MHLKTYHSFFLVFFAIWIVSINTSEAKSLGLLPSSDTLILHNEQDSTAMVSSLDTLAATTNNVTLTHEPDTTEVKHPLKDPIFSNADDSIRYSLDGQRVYMYGNAVVRHQNMELQASYIEFDAVNNVVFAKGMPDTSGVIIGKPIFKEGNQVFRMDSMHYNFETERAIISGVITEEAGGFLHSKRTKKMEDNTINVAGGKFTTCDLDHPHFYISITKAKIIPEKSLISGPAHLVIADVPLPLGVPFGFFPNTTSRASGILIPEYGEEGNRGFFLRGGGVYLGISDHIDMQIRGSIYSRGSWSVNTSSRYRKRYRYSGSYSVDFSENVIGEKGLEGYQRSQSYWLRWSHSQDPKANPNSTFQSSVNFGSPNYNKFNAQTVDSYLANSINSSISYSRVWPGTPFNFSASMNHSQNNRDSTISISLPRATLSMNRIFPFKPKSVIGPPTWYHRIGFSYTANVENSIATTTDQLFTEESLGQFRNGMRHSIPISTSFNVLNYITIGPSVSYNEYWYLSTTERYYDPGVSSVVRDTIPGFARAYQYNAGVSASTKLYGMFSFKSGAKVQAIRHVLTPSVSFSYRPDFSHPRYGFYRDQPSVPNVTHLEEKQLMIFNNGIASNAPSFDYIRDWENLGFYRHFYMDDPGNIRRYSIFDNTVYGGPGAGQSGTIGFSLGNNLEMKVLSDRDTTSDTRIIKIFESLNFNSSYNLMRDSMNLSPVSVSGRTTLFDRFSINFGGTLDPYALTEKGEIIDEFLFKRQLNPFRLTSARVSFGLSFQSNSGDKDNQGQGHDDMGGMNPDGSLGPPQHQGLDDPVFGQNMGTGYGDYVDFDVPWNARVDYSYNYSKPALESNVRQTLTFSGDIGLTPNWRIGFRSGYDLKSMKITTTSLNFFRDLHCWTMRLTVIPVGFQKSFSFQINVKSSVLQDLKLTKRQTHLDNL